MTRTATLLLALCASLASLDTAALAMGEKDFAAARQLTCVLAQESLGQLSTTAFADQIDSVLDGFDQAESDVIYAKAIGYFDGLMFGLPANDRQLVNGRLADFVASPTCSMSSPVNLAL